MMQNEWWKETILVRSIITVAVNIGTGLNNVESLNEVTILTVGVWVLFALSWLPSANIRQMGRTSVLRVLLVGSCQNAYNSDAIHVLFTQVM